MTERRRAFETPPRRGATRGLHIIEIIATSESLAFSTPCPTLSAGVGVVIDESFQHIGPSKCSTPDFERRDIVGGDVAQTGALLSPMAWAASGMLQASFPVLSFAALTPPPFRTRHSLASGAGVNGAPNRLGLFSCW